MAENPLIVPIVSPAGTVYFASVSQDAKVQDVIDSLVQSQDIQDEIVGDLSGEERWDLQKVRKEETGRVWEQEELEALGSDLLLPDAPIAPILASSSKPSSPERHFSAFPLTSHLHSPTVRLVSKHPRLRVKLSFLRVPEIHDGFEWNVYLSRNMTVQDVVNTVCERLGLVKSLAMRGGGAVDYIIEALSSESGVSIRLSQDTMLSTILEDTAQYRFCVPDEWYRRPNSRIPSVSPSEATLQRLSDLEEAEREDESEGTAKQKPISPNNSSTSTSQAPPGSPDSPGTFASRRFSNLFDGWLGSGSASTGSPMQQEAAENKRPIVSEPLSIERPAPAALDSESELSCEEEDFERMIDDLGLKGEKREAMRNMPADRKRYLLRQNRQMHSTAGKSPQVSLQSATIGPARTPAFVPAIAPNFTGDGIRKRFSISSWGSSSSQEASAETSSSPQTSGSPNTNETPASPKVAPLQPQTTGGLWGSWWTSSGTESWMSSLSRAKSTPSKDTSSTAYYAEGLRSRRTTDIKLVKHLISLRVHLSTAKVSWVEQFLGESEGMDALAGLLASLVGKGGKKRKLSDAEESVLYEVVKCLRVLLNTEPGFNQFLASPALITHVTYSLHTESLKLRTLACELLAAICLLSVTHGHRLVLCAFSDYRIAYEESFRFEELINSLRISNDDGDGYEDVPQRNDESAWEARTAAMTLVNAITTCPESLEERIQLREEFSRRGLNEIIVTLRYIRPPESIVTQIDVYTEEKFEDEEDLRERTRSLFKGSEETSELEVACSILDELSLRQEALRPPLIEVLRQMGTLLNREITLKFKADYLAIATGLLDQCIAYEEIGTDWVEILDRFASQVSSIIDEKVDLRSAIEGADFDSEGKEVEELRVSIGILEKERDELKDRLELSRAEVDTLQSLPTLKTAKGGKQSIQGLVQRLVAKERQVVQLQAELDRIKSAHASDTRDAEERVKHERDRVKWNALSEEIVDLKKKNEELGTLHQQKAKEILYLKRAMESVYSRLHGDSATHDTTTRQTQVRDLDAEKIAASAVEALSAKDDEITALRSHVQKLQEELKAKPKYVTESDFKKGVPPPPPPISSISKDGAGQRALSPHSQPASGFSNTFSSPPPPPRTMSLSLVQSQSSPLPPPPPPPPVLTLSGPPAPPPPPPIPGGSPPPPPPAPTFSREGSLPRLALPGKRLKPFFWNKVTTQDGLPSVWDDVFSDVPDVPLDLKELEETFALDAAPSRLTTSPLYSPRKSPALTLLDTNRANNILIMLSRMKPTLPEIKRALLTIDDSALSVDDLKAISKHLPTSDEMKRIREFGDWKQLAKQDQYLKEIGDIPRLAERIECMLYRRKFELEIEETRPELDIVRNTIKELRNSIRFKQVLKAVLTVGNALNGTSFRGNARGFQLDALLKMKETKTVRATSECPTLLHFLARLLLKTDAELVNFLDDLPHLEAAARVSMQTVSAAVGLLVSGLAQVQTVIRLQRQSKSVHPDDRFVQVMEPFVVQVTSSVQALDNMNKTVEAELKSLMMYYGESVDSPEGPKPEDFFSLITSFSSSLRKAALEVHEAMSKADSSGSSIASFTMNGRKANASSTSSLSSTSTSDAKEPLTPPPTKRPMASVLPEEPVHSTPAGFLIPFPKTDPGDPADTRHRSIGRGDLDETIKSMRRGLRRERTTARPLSKIFLDGHGHGH